MNIMILCPCYQVIAHIVVVTCVFRTHCCTYMQVFYEIFSDEGTGLLDYKAMLLYLCADPEPTEGLLKALSVTVGGVVTRDTTEMRLVITLEDLNKVQIL